MSSDDLHFRLKKSLSEFGQRLFMPEESDQKARQIIQTEVFDKLRNARLEYSVNRVVIYGSAGKHTGIWVKMDYDCAVFVNVRNFPRSVKEVDSLSNKIIPEWEALFPDIPVSRLSRGLKLTIHGIDVDIMLGFNATWEPAYYGRSGYQTEQVLSIVKEIHPLKTRIEFARSVSTSLCELSVDFMRQQSSVATELARVAKFWVYFSYPSEKWAAGRSTIIELVCVEALKHVNNKFDILECFLKFLDLMMNHRSWKIGANTLQVLASDEQRHMSKQPFIIDPSNPYNNMYNGPKVQSFLKEFAYRASDTYRQIQNFLYTGFWSFNWLWNSKPCEEEDWITLLKLLHVPGSARRHGIGANTVLITQNFETVYFSKCFVATGYDYELTNLMRFICYHAAFVPRKVTDLHQYVEYLQKALNETSNVTLQKTVFSMAYPVSGCNGFWIGM